MPLTMAAFTVGALGMIGVPPIAGFFSKWYIGMGGLDADQYWVPLVLICSSILNAAYFLPILYRGWFRENEGGWHQSRSLPARYETSMLLLAPPLITAALSVMAGVFAGSPYSPLSWARFIMLGEY
jgi:multicomponent Na+:H+ antiporter subunit D